MTQLFGHNKILQNLQDRYKESRLHHSLMICGAEGVGRETLITHFIKSVLKDDAKIDAGSHPHLFYIRPVYDEKKQRYKRDITLDSLAGLTNFLRLSPTDDLPRFIIIKPADGMNNQSQNALLKILEEPPKDTYFILLVTHISQILPTIRSRCLALSLELLNETEYTQGMSYFLPDLNFQEFDFYKAICNGNLGQAIRYKNEDISDHYTQFCYSCIEWIEEKNTLNAMQYAEKYSLTDMDDTIHSIIDLFMKRFSENIKSAAQGTQFYASHEIEKQLFEHIQQQSIQKLLELHERLTRVWQEGVDAYLDKKIVILSFIKVVASIDKAKRNVV